MENCRRFRADLRPWQEGDDEVWSDRSGAVSEIGEVSGWKFGVVTGRDAIMRMGGKWRIR